VILHNGHIPLHELSGGEVGSHGLIMLVSRREGVAERQPSWAIRPLQAGRLAETNTTFSVSTELEMTSDV